MIRAVLFDLDGTLLPMDLEVFIKTYLKHLAEYLAPHGFVPETLIRAVWDGTFAMIGNDGTATNEAVFWKKFTEVYGRDVTDSLPLFDEFYETEFVRAKSVCGFDPAAAETIRLCKELGLTVVLATNPIFPRIATEQRIRWAGLSEQDFAHVTTYENSHFAKPTTAYYREILETLALAPEECLMVGNDVDDDMPAVKLGMKGFLLTNHLINKHGVDIAQFQNGDFSALHAYLKSIV
ncbi:MAG: HAD family hydrolase [Oscillospiraceae bacterium]|nr:HAD family hydrolase [Oscillospiraceae bacterium]